MRGVHVGELAADDLTHATDVDARAVLVGAFDFLAKKHIIARNAHRLAAKVADHPDQAGIDFLGQHAGDDFDRFIGRHAEPADEFRLQPRGFHRGGDRLAAAVDDDGIDAGDFEENHVAHDAGDEIGIFHCGAAHFDDEGHPSERLQVGQGFDQGVGFFDGVHGG